VVDRGKSVQPSLIFASKSRTNPSGASYGEAILGWDARENILAYLSVAWLVMKKVHAKSV
jgi:hypothetical protein